MDPRAYKPRRYSFDNGDYASLGPSVRAKIDEHNSLPLAGLLYLDDIDRRSSPVDAEQNARDEAVRSEVIRIICVEILRKHREVKLIKQRLAKCYAAVERLAGR